MFVRGELASGCLGLAIEDFGDPCCDASTSTSSMVRFSHPFSTFTFAYDRRVFNSAESCSKVSVHSQPASYTYLADV